MDNQARRCHGAEYGVCHFLGHETVLIAEILVSRYAFQQSECGIESCLVQLLVVAEISLACVHG